MVKFSLDRDGFCGTFYKGEKHVQKAVIFMSGAGVNEKLTEASARFLIEEGYSVLVLGFYKWRGLPKEMYSVPVEYVQRAVRWLLSYQELAIQKIAIMGTSTGAGYALLCASLFPEISCVVAISPFDHIMEGAGKKFSRTYQSTYTYGENDIAFTPNIILDRGAMSLMGGAWRDKKYSMRRFMRYIYDLNPPIPSSRIVVENIKADLLMLAAKDDDFWPADEAVPRMEEVLLKSSFPYRVKGIVYERASHLLGHVPKMNGFVKMLIKMFVAAEKKYPDECEKSREDSVRQILLFLGEW